MALFVAFAETLRRAGLLVCCPSGGECGALPRIDGRRFTLLLHLGGRHCAWRFWGRFGLRVT